MLISPSSEYEESSVINKDTPPPLLFFLVNPTWLYPFIPYVPFFLWQHAVCGSKLHSSKKFKQLLHYLMSLFLFCVVLCFYSLFWFGSYAPKHIYSQLKDIIKWKQFPRYWPFVRGIHPHNGQWRGAFDVFFDLRLNKRLSKQSWDWWFETPSRPLWRHNNGASVERRRVPC